MALNQRHAKNLIRDEVNRKLVAIEIIILRTLSYIGELCVNEARELGSYRDQTGNLRASVGYIILHNGSVVKSDFGGGVGGAAGARAASEVGSQYPTGWALIVVAGMDYAADVESRGLDVLTSAELLAKKVVPGLIASLKQTIAQSQ